MKKHIILIILTFVNMMMVRATPTLTNFNVVPYSPPASNGNIIVGTTASTYANLHFGFSVPQVYNPEISGYESESVNFIVQVVYKTLGGEENLGQEYQFSSTNSPFNGGVGNFVYNLTIPPGKIGGQIKLKYHYKCTHSGNIFSEAKYSETTFTTYAATSSNMPFYKNINTGNIFIKIDGIYRHIYDQNAMQCFTTPFLANIHMTVGSLDPTPVGIPLGKPKNNWGGAPTSTTPFLAQDQVDGKVYFVEPTGSFVNKARYIVSPQVLNYYRFNQSTITIMSIPWPPPGMVGTWSREADLTMP